MVLFSVKSVVLVVLGFGTDLGLAALVVTRRDVAASVAMLTSIIAVVGVSKVVACVVAAVVTKWGRILRMVVDLAVGAVVVVVVVAAAAAVVAAVVIIGVMLTVVLVVVAFQVGLTGASVILGIYKTLVTCSRVVSSAGNISKGVATGWTDVTGSTAAVVGSLMEVSVVRLTAVSIPNSCSKST